MTSSVSSDLQAQTPPSSDGEARRWPAILAGIAALNVLCYWAFFVRPIGLFALYQRPLINLLKLTQTDPALRGRLITGYLILGALYWLGWRTAQRARGRLAWAAVAGGALASAVTLLFVMPIGAADIFDNIMHGRILGVHGANPFLHLPKQFPADPFFFYTAWRGWPSAYGPAWELLAADFPAGGRRHHRQRDRLQTGRRRFPGDQRRGGGDDLASNGA